MAVLLPALAGCGMPRDPENTTERVQKTRLVRVGVLENPPWTRVADDGQVTGVEADIVKRFAREFGAEVQWVPGAEPQLMEALAKRELDLLAGGLTAKTPWKKKVGLTRPWLTTYLKTGTRSPERPLDNIREATVAVDARQPDHAMHVREKGGKPVPRADLDADVKGTDGSSTEPSVRHVAAEDWQLELWGLAAGEKVLHKDKHVFAVPQGENGWLHRLDRFLSREVGEDEVRRELQKTVQSEEETTAPVTTNPEGRRVR